MSILCFVYKWKWPWQSDMLQKVWHRAEWLNDPPSFPCCVLCYPLKDTSCLFHSLSYWHRNPRTPVYHTENLWVKTSFKNDSFNCSHGTSARNEYTVRREAVARLMLRQMFSVMPLDNPSNPWKTRSLVLFLWVYLIYLSWQSFKILSHGSLWKSLERYRDRPTNSTAQYSIADMLKSCNPVY